MLRIGTLALGMAVGTLLAVPCSADTITNLISNGSFETFDSTSTASHYEIGNHRYYFDMTNTNGTYSSTTALSGWTAYRISQSTFYSVNTAMTVVDGSCALCISGSSATNPEWISQKFSVEAGITYMVSYYEKYRNSGGFIDSSVYAASGVLNLVASTVNAPTGNGTSLLTQHTLTTSSDWTQYTYSFTASEDTTVTLTFKTGDASNIGVYLDNVVVTVPEPSATDLVLVGASGLLAFAWRKRKKI